MNKVLLALVFAAVMLVATFVRAASAARTYENIQIFRPPTTVEIAERIEVIPEVTQFEPQVHEPSTKLDAAPKVVRVETIGIVSAYLLNVRAGPGISHAVLDTISLEDSVVVLKNRDGWLKIQTASDLKGWVAERWILLSEDLETAQLGARDVPLSPDACSGDCWVSNSTYYSPQPEHIIGRAVMYAPNLMEGSARFNGFDLDGFVGGVAMSNIADQGQVVWLRRDGVNWEGPFLVVDVSARKSVWTHVVERHQSVEVDFNTALRWGMADIVDGSWSIVRGATMNVDVFKGLLPPKNATRDDAIVYRDYFLSIVRFGSNNPADTLMWTPAYALYDNFAEYETALQEAGLLNNYVALLGQ